MSVYLNTNVYFQVWPRFRISTEFVAEYGEIRCLHAGTYVLHFDNHHSTFRNKVVAYNGEISKQSFFANGSGGDSEDAAQGDNNN